jgi:hypothetical protein
MVSQSNGCGVPEQRSLTIEEAVELTYDVKE